MPIKRTTRKARREGGRRSMRDKAKKRAKEKQNRGGLSYLRSYDKRELNLFEVDGKKVQKFDILPYEVTVDGHPEAEVGELWYERTIWVHYGIGDKPFLCPKTWGKKCPICDEYQRLRKDPDVDEETAKQLKAKERQVFNVRPVTAKGPGEIMLFEYSYHLFGRQLEEEAEDVEEGWFADLEGGSTIKVQWRKKSMGAKSNPFFEARKIDLLPREDLDESILEEVFDLDKLLVECPSTADLKKMLDNFGEGDDEEEEEDDEEEERPSRRRRAAKEDDEEEDDLDTEDDEEDEEEEEEDEEDEEEEEEDDEEEEEEEEEAPPPPKRTRKAKTPPAKPTRKAKTKTASQSKAKGKCPHGYTFGEDYGDFEECDECTVWKKCLAASQN